MTAHAAAPNGAGDNLMANFLGRSPDWYKKSILGFLVLNLVLFFTLGPVVTAWVVLAEFIFTLAMALQCFPLLPGGLLALQAMALGLTDNHAVYREVEHGMPVLLLVIFMVAGVHFLREMLFRMINHVLLGIRSRIWLNLATLTVVGVMSAFLDALTILAVLVALATGFYEVYHRVASKVGYHDDPDPTDDHIDELHREDLDRFRQFLRGLLMHGAVGTAIGGVATIVGEPENIVIGNQAGWSFMEFLVEVAPSSVPTFLIGLVTCVVVEKMRWFGYGAELPPGVRTILEAEDQRVRDTTSDYDRFVIRIQAVIAVLMVIGLAMHVAEIGLIGLAVIILICSIGGMTDEHRLADSFKPGLPFASLLVVFFVIVAMIESQHLFKPVLQYAMTLEGHLQLLVIYLANGALSAISDNVFVATVFITPLTELMNQGVTPREVYDAQAVAVVMGTGVLGMATPNGQAAFLYLLTSQISPLIRLGYGRMFWMAVPYTVMCGGMSAITMYWLL